jgi:tetratricopeptide (TPR) repeat protein
LDDYPLDRDQEIRSLLHDHPDQQDIIHAIACAFFARFMQSQQIGDLNSAVTRVEEVLQDCPADHPNRFQFLCSLASALRVRFDRLQQMEDLTKAVNCSQEALDLCTDDHPGRLQALYNLANVTQALFAGSKRDADLDETIRLYKATIELAPEEDPCRPWSYHNLAIAYHQRSDDLDSCIEANEHALKLRPKGHIDRGASLRKLGEVLVTRYNARPAREDDLERAITMYQEVFDLKPSPDPDDLLYLADALWLRFMRLDNADDIERVVELRRECLIHFPVQHPLHATMVEYLREAVVARGERLETIADLNEGVTLSEDLLGFTKFIPRETSLVSLAKSLESRWKLERNAEDLEKSITLYQDAIQLCFPNHPNRALCLLGFAHALHERYMRSKNKEDLEQAIALQCEATIPLRLSNHESVGNLGTLLAARFEIFYHRDDINKSIQHLTKAIELCSAAVPRAYWGYVKTRAHAYLMVCRRG